MTTLSGIDWNRCPAWIGISVRLRSESLSGIIGIRNLDLELATEPGRVTMVVAPNGAGKSVLRRAFHDLLFDIPQQSAMKFRHGYPGMALHAEAIDGDGVAFGFGWVRGGKPEPRVTTDAARFAALRSGVTPQQLERLFALDTRGLRDGGTDLKGGTTLASALLAGTGELTSAKSVRAIIEARRQANWGAGKSKPPLNAAARKLDDARRLARAAVQRPEGRERAERELDGRREEHDGAKQAVIDARADTRRLNRIALTRPHLQALAAAEQWLAQHPDAPALPAGLDQRLADARGAAATAQATHDAAQSALVMATEALDRIKRDPIATGLTGRLGLLPGALGEAEKTTTDIGTRRAELAAKLEDVRSALRAIGAAVPEHRAGDVIPTLGLMAEARVAITREAGLSKALELAEEGVAKVREALETAEAEPEATALLPDGLVALLSAIRADRVNPAQHGAELAEATRAASAHVTRLLALAPGWSGTAQALRALAVPSEAAFERLDGDVRAASSKSKSARDHLTKLVGEHDAARMALDGLREQPLPDDKRIAAARLERDQGMRLVLRRAFGTPPAIEEESAYAGMEPVALVYERQVRSADELADQRAAELGRVQEAERLARLLEDGVGPLARGEVDAAEAAGELEAARRVWASAVGPLGLDPAATMAELRKALAARLQVVEAVGAEEAASCAQVALRAAHHDWAVRLADLLAVPVEGLEALLGRADGLVASVRAAEHVALQRRTALDAARRGKRDAAAARSKAERDLEEWRVKWTGLLKGLHRPDGESPTAVSAVLDGIVTLDTHHRAAVSLRRRIDDMQDNLGRFASDVAGLAKDFGIEGASPVETARRLIARAAEAASAESAWRQARLGLDQAREIVGGCEDELSKAKGELAAVVAACGAATAADAEARIAASRDHTEYSAQRDAARRSILEHGDGLPGAALRAEADAVPVEEMGARRRKAEEEATAATTRAESAAVRFDQLRTALGAEAGATAAVDARADYEAAIAEFSRRLEEQLVLSLAGSMLGDALRAVEEQAGGSSLARVSEAFAAVTDGAYHLESRDGADGEELHAVERAHPQELKSLDDLSEGTRDQLYLALRMVALRDHCTSATALPFIADDILQTFDDARAAATLRAFGELSQDLQVIVLTHHAHLGRMAAELGDGQVHLVIL
jgi:uncharacterized protein YhaN